MNFENLVPVIQTFKSLRIVYTFIIMFKNEYDLNVELPLGSLTSK